MIMRRKGPVCGAFSVSTRTMAMRNKTGTAAKAALAAAIALLLAALSQSASAQTGPAQSPSTDQESLPKLELNAAQKQTIYTSIVNLNLKNESIPGFQPIAGAVVPEQIKLEPMPKTIVEHIPATAPYQIARVSNLGIIVDPKTRRIVEVLGGEKQQQGG